MFALIVLALFIGALLCPGGGESESIQDVMRDAVLHEHLKVSLFGLIEVNPGLISAYVVTAILIVFALVCRIFVIPRFTLVPGKFQLLLEQLVELFDGLAEGGSPHRNHFLSAYIFTAGVYIFVGTLFELLGLQAGTTAGTVISLPAPLSDINGAIAMGCMSYGVILFGGLIAAGPARLPARAQGFLAPRVDELPTVRRAALRRARHGACVLLHGAFLCAAGDRGRDVHAAARAHSGLCAHDARLHLLRGVDRAAREKAQGKENKNQPQQKRCVTVHNECKKEGIYMKTMKKFAAIAALLIALFVLSVPALAAADSNAAAPAETVQTVEEGSNENDVTSAKAMGAGLMIGIACLGGALAMGIAVGKSSEAIARQPEANGQIRTTMMMGLVFIETVIIYALIVAILIIFVL